MEKEDYRYIYASHGQGLPKDECPSCGTKKSWVRYVDTKDNTLLPEQYGKCERVNNCGCSLNPYEAGYRTEEDSSDKTPYTPDNRKETATQIFMNVATCEKEISDQSSNFHTFCVQTLNIPYSHLAKWLVGTGYQGSTSFYFQSPDKNFWNKKTLTYTKEGKRDKESSEYSCKQPSDPTQMYKICLYGWHLLSADKDRIVLIVESEKTAVIASYFHPEYDWMAAGSANGLTLEKIQDALLNRKAYWLCDADIAGREKASSRRNLQSYKNYNVLADLRPDLSDGEDIADFIIHKMPYDLAKAIEVKQDEPPYIQKEEYKEENVSEGFFEPFKRTINKKYKFKLNEILGEKLMFQKFNPAEGWIPFSLPEVYYQTKNVHEKLKKDDLKMLLDTREMQGPSFNPLKEYFEGLPKWDGKTDHITNLANHVKTTDQAYFLMMFKKHLVRCITSLYKPEMVNRFVFCLVGEKQDKGKSNFIRFLYPLEDVNYYKQEVPLSINKDLKKVLRYKWIFNLDDIDNDTGITRRLKAIISAADLSERDLYAQTEHSSVRITNFFATTNLKGLFTDETGNTRWLTFEVEDINWDYNNLKTGKSAINIHDVWAQAYFYYTQGYDATLTKEEQKTRDKSNKDYQEETIERELIATYLKPASLLQPDEDTYIHPVTKIMSLINSFLGKDNSLRMNDKKMRAELKNLGFEGKRYNDAWRWAYKIRKDEDEYE